MRIRASAGLTDAGRKRRRNEDAYVCLPPLFAVADGMGGAQAGEIASRLAAAAFQEHRATEDLDAEARLTAIIQEANRRIYERASSDPQASGMGTTITAALLEGERVVLGHVGDSRAYRSRGGRLEQLTDDHSLVADLVRSGRLTPGEAETHPQRSVITRALGTDPNVSVDLLSIDVRPDDVFLLCSDGLTTMLDEQTILRTIAESAALDSAARSLVQAANRSGGEDNITVVLFALEDGEPEAEPPTEPSGDGRAAEENLEDTLSGLEPITEEPPPPTQRPDPLPYPPLESPPRRRSRLGRWLAVSILGLILGAVVVAVALWGVQRAHFVGADSEGRVVVYQGLPWDLGAGVELYRPVYVSGLRAVQLSPEERKQLFDHSLVTESEARARIAPYVEEAVIP